MNLEVLWYWACRACAFWALLEIVFGHDAMSVFVIAASGAVFFLLGRRAENVRSRNDFLR